MAGGGVSNKRLNPDFGMSGTLKITTLYANLAIGNKTTMKKCQSIGVGDGR